MPHAVFRLSALLILLAFAHPPQALAAPGFLASKEKSPPETGVSTVIAAYDSGRMVLTFSAPVSGPAKDLAVIFPVPGAVTKEQVRDISGDLLSRLDSYSSPVLAESEDPSPCTAEGMAALSRRPNTNPEGKVAQGVKAETDYETSGYDISILAPSENSGLTGWLKKQGYHLPRGGEVLLKPYIGQHYSFVTALARVPADKKDFNLRPLQIAFNAPKFILPLRLAALSAKEGTGGEQDLRLFVLTRGGRVEAANLRNTRLPEGKEVPVSVAPNFGDFTRAVFGQAAKTDGSAAWLEFSGDALSCESCGAPALGAKELRELGAFWLGDEAKGERIVPLNPERGTAPSGGDAWLTRLHLRYRPGSVPDDLQLRETQDRAPFQPRFFVRKPWQGKDSACAAAPLYKQAVAMREAQIADNLKRLTGWPRPDLQPVSGAAAAQPPDGENNEWWKGLWKR